MKKFKSLIKNDSILLFAGFILTCLLGYLYFILTGNGLRAIYGDSWTYTDLAKRLAFNHSLLGGIYANNVIYPPLYSILISAAYFFRDQSAIFAALTAINILAYSSAFLPMFYLLKNYAGLSRSQSFAGAILLLMNWCSLGYVIYISSEPLYCSVLAWFAWFLADKKHLKDKPDLILFIILLSLIPLTRTAGNLVLPAFAGAMIIKLIYARLNHLPEESGRLIRRSIIALVASAVIIFIYNMYLKANLPENQGNAFGGYLSILADPILKQNLFKPSYWFDRTAFSFSWILIGTGTVAVPLLLAIAGRNLKTLFADILASFLFIFLAGTFVIVPLFTPCLEVSPPGAAHERYYNPFLFLFIVILLKSSRIIERKDMLVAGMITLSGVIIAPPLTTHAACFALSQTHLWAVYLLLYGGGGAAFAFMLFILHRHRKYFVNIFLIMMAVSIPALHFLDYLGGNKLGPNIFSFYDRHGITGEVLSERSAHPGTELVVDASWRGPMASCKYREYWKILINLPLVPAFRDVSHYPADARSEEKRFMVLTHRNISGADKVVRGKEISLYIFYH